MLYIWIVGVGVCAIGIKNAKQANNLSSSTGVVLSNSILIFSRSVCEVRIYFNHELMRSRTGVLNTGSEDGRECGYQRQWLFLGFNIERH